MVENQPRDEKGRFVKFDHSDPIEMNESKTVGVFDDSAVSPAIDMGNVSVQLLEEGIEKARKHGLVRIGVTTAEGVDENGNNYEKALIVLKGVPSDDEVVTVAGKRRQWDDDE